MSNESPSSENLINSDIEKRILQKLWQEFYITATLQGRLAYFLMSFHAVNPNIFKTFFELVPEKYVFANMVYGIGVMIYSRPSMLPISYFNRLMFSILGTLMFNHSSMLVYNWLVRTIPSERRYFLTFMGVFSGRVMMVHLMAYLYHVDSRFRGFHLRTASEYESMYRDRH